MHRTLPRLLLAVISVLALALGGCGGDDLSSKSAQDVLKETFGPDKPVESGKLDLRIALDAKGLQGIEGPVSLALRGPFESSGKQQLPRFDFDLNLDIAGQAVAAGAISTGTKGWLKFAGESFAVDGATFAELRTLYAADQKRTAARDSPTLKALGVDPSRWLADPVKAPEESVGGTQTVHVTSAVDVPAFLDDLNRLLGRADATGAAAATGTTARVPTKLTPAQRAQIERAIVGTRLDVYSGKEDGTLRRLNLQVRFDAPAAAPGASKTTGTLGLDLVISELNEKQEIAAPRRSRPLADLTRAGVTGATGATGAQAPAAADPAAEKYRACLEAAGSDIGEVQGCAPLLDGP